MQKIKLITVFLLIITFILQSYALNNDTPSQSNSVEETFKQANLFEQKGLWKKANDLYVSIHKQQPTRFDVLLKLVEINNAQLHNPRQAIVYLKQMIVLKPNIAHLYFRLAQLYSQLNEPSNALNAMNFAIQLEPNNLDYLEFQLFLARWSGDYASMEIVINRILHLYPNNQEALLMKARLANLEKNYNLSVNIYKKLLKLNPHDKNNWEKLINAYTWQGKYSVAKLTVEKFLKQFPSEKQKAETLQAWILSMEGEGEASLMIVDRLLKNNPNDPELLSIKNLAEEKFYTQQRLINPKKAIDYFQKLAQQAPSATIYYNLAQAYSSANDPMNALAAIQKATELEPNNLVFLNFQLSIANWIDSPTILTSTVENILRIDSSNRFALQTKARLSNLNKDYKTAIIIYKNLLKENIADKTLWKDLINVYTWSGDYNSAFATLSKFSKNFPDDPDILKYKAWILAMAGEGKQSLAIVNELLKLSPKDPWLISIKQLAERKYQMQLKFTKLSPQLAVLVKIFPIEGLNAEENKQWGKAIDIYKAAYSSSDNKYQLLLRIAQIQEYLHQNVAAATTLNEATKFTTDKAQLYKQIAVNYVLAKKAKLALNAIDKALALAPTNLEFLHYRGSIAERFNLPKKAYQTYLYILSINPTDKTALLAVAYYLAHSNYWDEAIKLYQHILMLYPKNETALLMLASVQSWIGDYRASMHTLSIYHFYYGSTTKYLATKARTYAESAQALHALALIKPLLKNNFGNFNYLYTLALAYYYNWQPQNALKVLAQLNRSYPQAQELVGLDQFIKTPLKSSISPEVFFSKDTDSIRIESAKLNIQNFISPITSLLFQGETEHLAANQNSGLNAIDGSETINYQRGLFGFNHIFTPYFSLKALGGAGHTENTNLFIYDLAGNFKLDDNAKFAIIESHQLYDVSPRTVSLGIKRQLTQINAELQPSLQRFINSSFSYATFSDGNTMWQEQLNPMVALYRTQRLQINGGLYANWFGFSKTLSNGYYDPSFYQFYGAMAHFYYVYSDNIGYSFSVTLGEQKDETFERFKFANDLSLKAFYGLYKNYLLIFSANSSNRGRSISSGSTANNNYNIYSFNIALIKRF